MNFKSNPDDICSPKKRINTLFYHDCHIDKLCLLNELVITSKLFSTCATDLYPLSWSERYLSEIFGKWIFIKLADMVTFPTNMSKVKNFYLVCKQLEKTMFILAFVNLKTTLFHFISKSVFSDFTLTTQILLMALQRYSLLNVTILLVPKSPYVWTKVGVCHVSWDSKCFLYICDIVGLFSTINLPVMSKSIESIQGIYKRPTYRFEDTIVLEKGHFWISEINIDYRLIQCIRGFCSPPLPIFKFSLQVPWIDSSQ